MNHDETRTVLLIHPGALGDMLLALPAMQALRARYPSHRMLLVSRPDIGGLLHMCRAIDEWISIDSQDLTRLFAGDRAFSPVFQSWLDRCDVVVGWLRDHDGVLRETLSRSGIFRIVIESPTPQHTVHQSRRFLSVMDELDANTNTNQPALLALPESVKRVGVERLGSMGVGDVRSIVVCHPGSGSPAKCIRPDVMAEVIRQLAYSGMQPVIVGGPADDELVQQVIACGLQNVAVLRHQPLDVLAGVLSEAALFVGHDSGVTHLAAAIGIPTLAFFGPTDPCQWAPQGRHVTVVSGRPCECIGWEQVLACSNRPCLSISADTIIKVAIALIARYQSVTKS